MADFRFCFFIMVALPRLNVSAQPLPLYGKEWCHSWYVLCWEGRPQQNLHLCVQVEADYLALVVNPFDNNLFCFFIPPLLKLIPFYHVIFTSLKRMSTSCNYHVIETDSVLMVCLQKCNKHITGTPCCVILSGKLEPACSCCGREKN